jgi:hypothetical protein
MLNDQNQSRIRAIFRVVFRAKQMLASPGMELMRRVGHWKPSSSAFLPFTSGATTASEKYVGNVFIRFHAGDTDLLTGMNQPSRRSK